MRGYVMMIDRRARISRPPWTLVIAAVFNVALSATQLPIPNGIPQEPKIQPVPVVSTQSSQSLIWLAAINVGSLVLLAIITRLADAKKDKHTAQAMQEAAVLAARIKKEEKEADWKRQDEVAAKVAEAAKAAADTAAEAIRRQDIVAANVQVAATQAASAATLLVNQQAETRVRQDAVADKVQAAALQAAEAAKLLASAQEQMALATKEVARVAAESQNRVQAHLIEITEQGRKIHVLVNSDMTAARTAERDSLKLLLMSLRNSFALSVKLGLTLIGDEEEEIAKVQRRIQELDQILADRLIAQQQIEREAYSRRATDERPVKDAWDRKVEAEAMIDATVALKDTTSLLGNIAKSTADTAKTSAETAINTKK